MKKFSTYNGLFTGCPSTINVNSTQENYQLENDMPTMSNESATDKDILQNSESQTQTDIFHYPQSEKDYDIFNQNQINNITTKPNNMNFAQNNDKINDYAQGNVKQFSQNNENNLQTNTTLTDNENQNTNLSQNEHTENTLSKKAKFIFECMKMHDKIIQNFEDKR